ncbi:hypothetical protein CVT24_001587 [Panaeolus cyanescens]|uniref:Protein-S-isoprenylcysteine O-methyltransferase n=1 Tax=Panaeolus cyanescens TaxID=181874 RepID=A0A409YFE9_9AGAR|nr:hypothetical protein CVT24_001587 [Panaeolus cyanescens]
MIAVHISTTPPHPPPSNRERSVPSTWMEVILTQRWSVYIIQAISWAAALAEISVIISQLYPRHPLSRIIRSNFISPTARHPAARRNIRIRLTWKACAAWCLATSGAYLRYLCYKSLGSLFTFEMSIRDDHRLVKNGPYKFVRHPSYLGLLMTVIGFLLWHASRGSWVRECGHFTREKGGRLVLLYVMTILLIITGLLLRMRKEDEALKIRFGQEWDEWADGVRFKLIPIIF